MKHWTDRLKKYPRWRISELGSYTGPLNYEVFKYLNLIQSEPQSVREATGYNKNQIEHKPNNELSKDFSEHVHTIMNFKGTREERVVWEFESFKKLDAKYPHLNVLNQVRDEKRFKDFGLSF